MRIRGLALSSPSTSFTQNDVMDLTGLTTDQSAETIFARASVERRQLDVSDAGLTTTLQERTSSTEDHLFRMATQAVDQLAIDPEEIGLVVSATFYSLGGPSLAHRIVDHYDLDPATDKYHVVGIGCASAVPLFRLAADWLPTHPGQKALVVAAESISGLLTRVEPGDPKVKLVGSALFGDGCAAVLLDEGTAQREHPGERGGPEVLATAVHQVPGTLGHVRFMVSADDSYFDISRELPAVAEGAIRPLVEAFLEREGLDPADIDHWMVHPGGPRIIQGIQRGLGLSDDQVASSVHVLTEHGNVATPASLFVFATTIDERQPALGDRGLMITVGPGVTIGLMLLEWSYPPFPDHVEAQE